jgi:acyl carrier protein
MKQTAQANPTPSPTGNPTDREDRIKHLPESARAAFHQFQKDSNPATLDPIIFAILEDFVPQPPARPLADLPGSTSLIEGLGFDSLAITEVVFFTEDLFGITITNEEIMQVRTLEDLRNFIHRKVTPRSGR